MLRGNCDVIMWEGNWWKNDESYWRIFLSCLYLGFVYDKESLVKF